MGIGNWLIVRMLRSAIGLGGAVNNDLSGWIRVLPAGPFSASRRFPFVLNAGFIDSASAQKRFREKSFLPHLIARKGVDCTDGGNGSHVDAWPKYPPSYALWFERGTRLSPYFSISSVRAIVREVVADPRRSFSTGRLSLGLTRFARQ
jgi:hypothetical protein